MLRKIIKPKIILTLCILPLLACGCMANDSDMFNNHLLNADFQYDKG